MGTWEIHEDGLHIRKGDVPTITTVAIAVFIRDGEAEADDTKVYQGLYEEIDCKVTYDMNYSNK